MARIVVLGAGLAGSAFCVPLADQGHEVSLVGTPVDRQVIEALAQGGFHPRLGVRLPPSVTPLPHERLAEALRGDVALVVIAVSTAGVPWAAEQLAAALAGSRAADPPGDQGARGRGRRDPGAADAGRGRAAGAAPRAFRRRRHRRPVPGPRAGGAARDRGGDRPPRSGGPPGLIDLVSAPYYHVRPSTDVVGVEACAALKNLVVMAVGAVMGQLEVVGEAANGARMHNAAAAVFSQALGELEHLVHALGGASRRCWASPAPAICS